MRIPVTGGPPEEVLTARLYRTPGCARSPSTLCAFAEQAPDAKELVFTAFDPIRGKGHELVRFATDPNAGDRNWSLSPDGTRIGMIKTGGNHIYHIYMLPLDGSSVRDLTLAGWSAFNTFDWSADGTGFFISNATALGATQLFVDVNGKPHTLWQQRSSPLTWGVPSPNGRYLALLGQEFNGNMWMIENF
jgi:Tol biopolymer transport system component